MNAYEVLLMLDPELAEEKANEVVARMREQVEADGGSWDGHEPWGRRKLAYEINHKPDGVYHLLLFTAALLGWLTALSWPRVAGAQKFIRVVIVLALVGMAVLKFIGRL